MEKKANIMDSLNQLGLSIYIITIGSISYLIIKGVKKLVDILAESLLQKYIESIRNEVEVYLVPMNKRLEEMDEEIKGIRRHESNNAKHSERLLELLGCPKIEKEIEKRIDEKLKNDENL